MGWEGLVPKQSKSVTVSHNLRGGKCLSLQLVQAPGVCVFSWLETFWHFLSLSKFWRLFYFIFYIYFIYLINLFRLSWVLVAALRIFVVVCGRLSCGMQTLSCGMWTLSCGMPAGTYFPDQGSTLGPLHWEHGVLPIGPPGKSLEAFLNFWLSTFCD